MNTTTPTRTRWPYPIERRRRLGGIGQPVTWTWVVREWAVSSMADGPRFGCLGEAIAYCRAHGFVALK